MHEKFIKVLRLFLTYKMKLAFLLFCESICCPSVCLCLNLYSSMYLSDCLAVSMPFYLPYCLSPCQFSCHSVYNILLIQIIIKIHASVLYTCMYSVSSQRLYANRQPSQCMQIYMYVLVGIPRTYSLKHAKNYNQYLELFLLYNLFFLHACAVQCMGCLFIVPCHVIIQCNSQQRDIGRIPYNGTGPRDKK